MLILAYVSSSCVYYTEHWTFLSRVVITEWKLKKIDITPHVQTLLTEDQDPAKNAMCNSWKIIFKSRRNRTA